MLKGVYTYLIHFWLQDEDRDYRVKLLDGEDSQLHRLAWIVLKGCPPPIYSTLHTHDTHLGYTGQILCIKVASLSKLKGLYVRNAAMCSCLYECAVLQYMWMLKGASVHISVN